MDGLAGPGIRAEEWHVGGELVRFFLDSVRNLSSQSEF